LPRLWGRAWAAVELVIMRPDGCAEGRGGHRQRALVRVWGRGCPRPDRRGRCLHDDRWLTAVHGHVWFEHRRDDHAGHEHDKHDRDCCHHDTRLDDWGLTDGCDRDNVDGGADDDYRDDRANDFWPSRDAAGVRFGQSASPPEAASADGP
jgi:hypothetical protein